MSRVDEGVRKGGLLRWVFLGLGKAPMIFRAVAKARSHNALGQAYLLVGKQNVVRIDPPESENPISLDNVARAVTELPRLARSHAEATGHCQMFLGHAADRFIKCASSKSLN